MGLCGFTRARRQQKENKTKKLKSKTVKELRDIAKTEKIQGYYDMRKDDLINALVEG